MNKTLSDFARQYLKRNLVRLEPANHHVFRLMYSHRNMDRPLDDVVDAMSDDKLDWAMTQIKNSLTRLKLEPELPVWQPQ